jgi:transcription antitermination factor NusG
MIKKINKMNQQWYAVYTKNNCESKVVNQLNKRKITNFCAINSTTINSRSTRKPQRNNLLPCIVFVCISTDKLPVINKIKEITNVLYWMGEPAIINTLEIEYLEYFTTNYQDLMVERVEVVHQSIPTITTEQKVDIMGSVIALAQQQTKLILPSLGFAILANTENTNIDDVLIKKVNNIKIMH